MKILKMENKTEKDTETAVILAKENFMRLMLLINKNTVSTLREIFCKLWISINGTEWQNTVETGSTFINGSGKSVYRDSRPIQKKILESGNIEEWDLPLLIKSIKSLDIKGENTSVLLNDETMSRCKRNKHFDSLKEVRNKLAHAGNLEMDSEKFEEMWKSVSDVLISFGVPQSELDSAKSSPLSEEKSSKNDSYINEKNTQRATELKEQGNKMYKENNYSKAIEFYSEAILQEGIPSQDLSILYSNRSIAFWYMNKFENAKEDAKGAIHLRPTWWKGYFRLGSAYKAMERMETYNRALKNFDLALFWKPPDSEKSKLTDERDHCRHTINKLERKEHLDPMNHAISFDEIADKLRKDIGLSRSGKQLHASQKRNFLLGDPVGICGEAHNYKNGRGVPQNYELAAKYYAEAISKGSAEGMYNLALMTLEGQGVKRNIAEGIKLLEQAASQPPLSMDIMGHECPNLGVAEAEHALGIKYQEGVGVPRDFEKALYWYTRSTKHGLPPAPNNIGCMYSKGIGVERNLNTTIDYWKLAASRKLVRAMDNLAILYLQLWDVTNARNWFMFGMKNGSLELKTLEEEFKMLIGDTAVSKSFREDLFELEILEEVKNGPLKHLIPDDLPNFNFPSDPYLSKATECAESSTSRKLNDLEDPYRTFIIKVHRGSIKEMMKRGEKSKWEANPARLQPKTPLDLIGLKPIFFEDMDSSKDHIYEGFVLKLTFIQDAALGKPSIGQIGEDEKGDAQRVYVYNFAQNKETQTSLGFGCKVSIVNPYFRLAMDGKPAIRVDDTSLLFLHSNLTDKNRCRYCGKEKCSVIPCRKCKRSFYCSKKCLLQDASLLDHGLVCFKRM